MKEEALALADYLDNNVEAMLFTEQPHLDRASAMIRRLVEELDEKNYRILELTKRYKALTWNDKQVEPVAWALTDKRNEYVRSIMTVQHDFVPDGCIEIPLYTKPQTKPLSDEEIMEIFKAYEQMQEYGYVGKKPFQVYLGWSLEDRNSCLMLARAIEERHGIK